MTARAILVGVLMLVSAHAHSQCEIKRYQDMLFVSAGPGCLAASGGRESIASGVKGVVNELNEVSRERTEYRDRDRHLSRSEKLYRLAELQHRDRLAHDLRVQSELRQTNRVARQQRGVD